MKKILNYLFYGFYIYWEKVPAFQWWSEGKAVTSIGLLIIFMLSTILNTTMYITGLFLLPETTTIPIILVIIMFGFLHYHFIHKDKWRNIIADFSKNASKKTNRIAIAVVLALSVLIISGMLFSWYLLSIIPGWYYTS